MSYTLLGGDGRSYESDVKGQWGGHRGTKIYGRLDCPSALRAIARGGYVRQRVFFADEATAIAADYRPCATCCRDRYDAWKVAGREHTPVIVGVQPPAGPGRLPAPPGPPWPPEPGNPRRRPSHRVEGMNFYRLVGGRGLRAMIKPVGALN